MAECTCPKHRFRASIYKAFDGFCNRKASMTLIAFGMVILVCMIAGKVKPLEDNLPTVLGAIIGILTIFITGHAVDQRWTPSGPTPVEKKDLPGVAKAVVKEVEKKEEKDEEEGC